MSIHQPVLLLFQREACSFSENILPKPDCSSNLAGEGKALKTLDSFIVFKKSRGLYAIRDVGDHKGVQQQRAVRALCDRQGALGAGLRRAPPLPALPPPRA